MSPTSGSTLLGTLKDATWHRHARFEQLPFVVALQKGTLPRRSYAAQLQSLAIIVGALERSLAHCPDPSVVRVLATRPSRFELLRQDLAHLSDPRLPDIPQVTKQALALAQRIRAATPRHPSRLLGYLYVLEGTTLGNRVHLEDVRRCTGLKGEAGTAYYQGYGLETRPRWESFQAAMEAEAGHLDPGDMLAAAEDVYESLEHLHERLYPIPADPEPYTSSDLNPKAGDHPVPQDPDLLQAAIRSGEACWNAFPYLGARFGLRGIWFTDSDAAWLATFVDEGESFAAEQALWLGQILSVRGIPRYLVERQVAALIQEVDRTTFRRPVPVAPLLAALAALAEDREDALPWEVQEGLEAELRAIPGTEAAAALDLAGLLAVGLADELAGLPQGLTSVLEWFRSEGHLAPGAEPAALAALQRARDRVRLARA